MRASQRFLGLMPGPLDRIDDVAPLAILFTAEARRSLGRHLAFPGRLRGGLLFGQLQRDQLEVQLVSSLGPQWWLAQPEPNPLDIDACYVLGWSDALEEVYGGRVDWLGQWIVMPDNRLPDLRDDLTWLDQAARRGLVDERHPLVVIGWVEGYLTGRAYGHDEGEPVEWNCRLNTRPDRLLGELGLEH